MIAETMAERENCTFQTETEPQFFYCCCLDKLICILRFVFCTFRPVIPRLI